MIKYPKFLGAGAAQDTRAINCVVSLPRLRSVCPGLRIIRCIPLYTSEAAPQSSVLTLTSWYWGTPGPGTRGRVPTTESPGERDNKTCEDWADLTNQRPEVRPGDQWGAVTRPVCQWPGATRSHRDKSRSGSVTQSALVLLWPRTQTGDRECHEREYLAHRDTIVWSVMSRSIQDLWIDSPLRGDVPWPTKTWQITNNYPDYKVGRHKNSLKTLFTISLDPPPTTEQLVCHVIKERKENILFFLFSYRTKKLIESK